MMNAPHAPANGAAAASPEPKKALSAEHVYIAPDIGREDWDILYTAVIAQLRHAVDVRFERESGIRVLDAGSVRARVLACASALERLRAARPR